MRGTASCQSCFGCSAVIRLRQTHHPDSASQVFAEYIRGPDAAVPLAELRARRELSLPFAAPPLVRPETRYTYSPTAPLVRPLKPRTGELERETIRLAHPLPTRERGQRSVALCSLHFGNCWCTRLNMTCQGDAHEGSWKGIDGATWVPTQASRANSTLRNCGVDVEVASTPRALAKQEGVAGLDPSIAALNPARVAAHS